MSGIIAWLKIILPPFLMLPLLYFPFDLSTIIFWVGGLIVIAQSLSNLIKSTYRRLTKNEPFRKELIRPLLAIIIIVMDVILVIASQNSADAYARRIANTAQEQCNRNRECPELIDGMELYREGISMISYGEYGAKYTVVYKVLEDKKAFEVNVRHNIDEFYRITGGVDKEIEQNTDLY